MTISDGYNDRCGWCRAEGYTCPVHVLLAAERARERVRRMHSAYGKRTR